MYFFKFDTPVEIAAQIVGFFALLFCVLSFQFKESKKFIFMQIGVNVFFCTQFILLRGWSGVIINAINLIRTIIFTFNFKEKTNKRIAIVFDVLFAVGAIISIVLLKDNPIASIAAALAAIFATVAMATKNIKTIRIMQIGIVSPCWVTSNLIHGSLGGVAAEVFNVISIFVATLREKKQESKLNNEIK